MSVDLLEVFPSIDQMAERVVTQVPAQQPPGQPGQQPQQSQEPKEAKPIEPPQDPYEPAVLDSIKAFFRKRSKKGGLEGHTFTADGNLEIKDPAGTIQLKRFLPLEPADREALEEFRLDTIAVLEEEYAKQRRALREAWDDYYNTGETREVLAANKRVAELDARRCGIRSAVRNIVPIDNPVIREVILNNPHETRRMYKKDDPFDQELMRLCFYDFNPEHDMGKYVVDQNVAAELQRGEAEAAAGEPNELLYRQTLKDGRRARIFFDKDADVNGFLSPMWPVDFTMGDTKYCMALQAYEVERARELGMNELAASLLKTRSARMIRLMTVKVKAHPANAKGLWLKIYTEIYQQTEALKTRLLTTGTDTLVYADVREGPSGIGLAEKDSGVLDPTKWKGENAVGVAQETVRTQMREGELAEAPVNAAAKGVITEEEQAKAKVGAIIQARRSAFKKA
jgi:predicted NAD-dependent protein-ADP-ribosyltransferase YbiA (DUF1768 family)